MTNNKSSITAIVLFLSLCFSAACQPDLKNSLVGRWKNASSSEGWEFRADNTFERMDPLGFALTGKYKIDKVDSQNVTLSFDSRDANTPAPEPLKVKITVRGDEMSLDDGERIYSYVRDKSAKPEISKNVNVSTSNTSDSSGSEQKSGNIEARDLLEYEYVENNPSSPQKYEGRNMTVTGSFDEYTPKIEEGKTVWFSDKVRDNGTRVACRIADSDVSAAAKLKKDQKITVNGTVGKYLYGFYLDLTNCKIVNQ